jgi:hypothetical protein
VAASNPVTKDAAAETKPADTSKAQPKAGNPLDKFKTELPNGLTLHNFVDVE